MNKKTRILVGIDRYKEYDEQQEIKSNYFKGCTCCEEKQFPVIFDKKNFDKYIFKIKNNKLLLFKESKDIDIEDIVNSTYIPTKEYIGYFPIQFCPFCGKQLVKDLKKYLD